jgi:hypothetical protein
MRRPFTIVLITLFVLAAAVVSQAATIKVTQISIEAVYVNAGTDAGLVKGDTLIVSSGKRRGVRLVVTNLSSKSSACKKLRERDKIEVGDVLMAARAIRPPAKKTTAKSSEPRKLITARKSARERALAANRVRGFITLHTRWQKDLSGSNVSWMQPGISGRISVNNIGGKHINFRLRHSSRYSYRTFNIGGAPGSQDDWTHRLSELSLTYLPPGSPVEIGVGRVISPYIRGVGYIDGGYVAVNPGGRFGYGMALGTEPYVQNSFYNADSRKIGFFLTHTAGSYDHQRLASTIAISGSYNRDVVSREFVYLQNAFSHARRFTAFQSVEIDINRHWRMDVSHERFSFSNFYATANWVVTNNVSIDGSVDARKNVYSYPTKDTPDSLFDRSLQRGFDGGISLKLPKGVSLRANGGVRYGESPTQNNQFASVFLNTRNFIRRGHNLSLRMSRSHTQFTTTYGPLATYRFPLTRRTRAYLSSGGYIYDSQGIRDNNIYVEGGANRTLLQRYYVSGSWRQYLSGTLKSSEVDVEFGVSF